MQTAPLLAGERVADAWFRLVSPIYDPVVGTLFWPPAYQTEAVERLGVAPGDRVLDVGCGTGATAAALRERTHRVDAVDLSPTQLRRAKRRADVTDVRFVRADANRLPYRDATFDAVASVGAVLYWPDPEAVLREIHRVTRPDGRLLLAGFNRRPGTSVLANVAASAWFEALYRTYGATEATEMCRAAGYRDVTNRITGPVWHPTLVVETVARKPV